MKIQALRRLEFEESWFEFSPYGWSIWRVLRFAVFRSCDGIDVPIRARLTFGKLWRASVSAGKFAALLVFGRKARIFYKSCRSALRVEDGGRVFDNFLDTALLGRDDFLKFEEVNAEGFNCQASRAAIPSAADPSGINFLSHLLAYLSSSAKHHHFCKYLADKISKEVGIEFSARSLSHLVKVAVWQERLYTIFLTRMSTRLVVLTDTGDYGLRLAALKLGINVVECQHGVFDESHPDAIPDWVQGSQRKLIEPTCLLVRGRFFSERLMGTRLYPARIRVCGFDPIDRCREARTKVRGGGVSAIKFLVTSQGHEQDEICSWILRLRESAPSGVTTVFRVKLHPVYDHHDRFTPQLSAFEGIEVIPAFDRRSVYDLLVDSDASISISSATHYDAAAVGVPSFVLPLKGHEIVSRSADGLLIRTVREASDVWRAVLPGERVGVARVDTDYYCEAGFSSTVQELIELWTR